jgi:hypothetical protein
MEAGVSARAPLTVRRTISECVPWRARRYCSWAKGAPAQMLRVNSALRDMSPADAACHRAWHETIAWATSSDASQSATTIRGMARRARATPGPGSSGAGRRASVTQTDALSPPRSRSIGTPSAWRRIGGVLFPPCSHPGGAEFGMVPWIWLCRAFSRARPTGFEPVTFGSVDRRSIGRIPHGRAVHRLARHCCITFSALQVIVMSLHVASGAPHRARELLGAAPRRLLRPIENWSTLAG